MSCDHSVQDCLCDVHVVNPTPIRFGFGPRGEADSGFVHGSDILFESRDYGAPWTSEKLGQFMEELMAGWEKAWEQKRATPPRSDLALAEGIAAAISEGNSMVDVPCILGLTMQEVMEALSCGQKAFYWGWSDLDWLHFESLLDEEPLTVMGVARSLGMKLDGGGTYAAIDKLVGLYGKKCQKRADDPVNAALADILRGGMTKPRHYCPEVRRRGLGGHLSDNALRQRANRIKSLIRAKSRG